MKYIFDFLACPLACISLLIWTGILIFGSTDEFWANTAKTTLLLSIICWICSDMLEKKK
jgi:hypothetical protein